MTNTTTQPSQSMDMARQITVLVATPMIWIASSLGLFLDSARSPSEFSDLSENLLVPQSFAFSIWFPIFIGMMAYGVIQSFRANRQRAVYRETGWWIAIGLWGIVAWGFATSFLPDPFVELAATLIFVPSMIALVIGMVRMTQRKAALDTLETWLVLIPVSLIAGWCSIAVFVGLNGLIWSLVEPSGWSAVWTAVSILSLALAWVIAVLRKGAMNRIYALPVIWGLGFLALRHFSSGGETVLGLGALTGIILIALAVTWKTAGRDHSAMQSYSPAE